MKKRIALAIVITLMISTLTFSPKPALSQETPLVYVDPPLVEGLLPSETFSITVKVANITGLYGLDIRLQWDPTILDYVSHQAKIPVETYPEGVLYNTVLMIMDTPDPVAGTYVVAGTSLSPAPTFNGTGTVFQITFEVIGIGQTALDIYSTALADKNANSIAHNVQDGFFTNYTPTAVSIYVDPEQVVDSELTPSSNFTVDIKADGADKLRDFEFWLEYNTTILDTVDISVNPIFPTPTTGIFETEGQIQIAGSTAPSFSGDLTLASITFHVTETGESTLDLYNITFINEWDDPLPLEEAVDGYFSNILRARLWIEPEEIIDPLLTPGSEFSVDIMVEDVFNLYGYTFTLSYSTAALTCLGSTITPLNETNFTTEIVMDDANGYILLNVTYFPPAEPFILLSPTKLATIYFQVQSYGCTTLDLHDTELINELGGSIAHDVGDGFFCTLIADVAIADIVPSPEMVYAGRIVNVTVISANLGDTTATFNVSVYYDSNLIGTQPVYDLLPGQNRTLIFSWDTTGLEPCTSYDIRAEASPVDYELDLSNNVLTAAVAVKIKLLGDVNGDGIIDIFDIVLTAQAYQSTPGDPEWNPEADVAPMYGLIDIFDIVTVASMYGTTCEP